jgi:hypothetical protein
MSLMTLFQAVLADGGSQHLRLEISQPRRVPVAFGDEVWFSCEVKGDRSGKTVRVSQQRNDHE